MAVVLRPEEEKMFEGQPKGFPFGDFDIADVMLPEGDNMGIASDDEEEEEELVTETGFGHVVVIDNIPKVGTDKYDKLTSILKKILSGSGKIRENGLVHPVDEATNTSKGFCFVEYENPEQARAARDALDGYQLDKSHKFVAILFDDIERLAKIPEEYVEVEDKAFTEPPNLVSWLSDRRGRDQFAVRFADEAVIAWNDAARQNPDVVYKRSFWTEAPFVNWSPHGSMIATMHPQGVAVWGGEEFTRLARFSHPGVQRLLFSPCEKYVLTYSELPPDPRTKTPMYMAVVHETRTGRKLRVFEGPQSELAVGAAARPDGGLAWPAFRWSGGDSSPERFLAHLKRGGISVYAAPDMGMLDKRSVRMDNVHSFDWSPSDPVLCAYQEEQGNLPARVVLLQLPSREEVRAKNLFSVADVKMAWHPQGDYLAIRVEKWTKTRKSTTTNLELFSLREKNVPVDMLELTNKSEKVLSLAWEPKGHRFAVLHGDPARPSVSIYSMRDAKGVTGVHHLHTMTNKQCTSLQWSPSGRFLLLAGLKGSHAGKLEWWDIEELQLMSANEHFMASEVEWDPTGRYVTTSVTAVQQMENGYQVWSFAGQPLYKVPQDRFFQFTWRPRPPTLLSADQVKEIAKNLKKYTKRYEEEDEAMLMQADTEFLQEREAVLNEWRSWRASKDAWVAEQKAGIKALFGARWRDETEDWVLEEVEVSAVVDVKEEPAKMP